MKNKFIGLFAIVIGLSLTACGPSQEELDAMDAEADAFFDDLMGDDGAEDTVEAEPMTISAEMADFIAPFDGDFESVEASLAKYGANDDIIEHDMGMFDLKNPEVTAQNGDCYSLTCISGAVENYYEVCWEDGQIVSIEETY